MVIQKLIKQFGEYGNEYSLTEIGDTVNQLMDLVAASANHKELTEEVKIVTPEAAVEPDVVVEVESVKEDSKGGIVVRSPSSGDKVYYVLDGKKKHVHNPEELFALGFTFGSVQRITNEELDKYETIEDVGTESKEPLKVEDQANQKKNNGFDKYNL